MKHFTQKSLNPAAKTIELIKQFAHTYRTVRLPDGSFMSYCLN